uniref:DNA-directed RNA polymerase III subunit RPC3 n=2 Tax=Fagus sylvatica TaxID=28930 RepID=A0A2N9GLI8_FAGSY
MAPPFGIKLAVHLIAKHFGNLVAKVCENVARRGPLTLQQIIRNTELTPQQVKNSLLILIQHNCVQAFSFESEGGLEDGPKVNCQYVMIFSNILHRMRFSKFLEIVSRELDDEGCKELLEGLLQNGRLTLKQIVDRAKAPFEKGKPGRKEGKYRKRFPAVAWLFCLTYLHDSSLSCGVDLEEQTMGPPEGFREDVVRESFLKLLNAHFVERCPAPEPFLPAPVKAETTKKRGAKSAKINEESETIEQRVLAAAAPTEVQRFSMIINTESNVSRETSMDDSPSMIVGEKRKHDSLELDRESTAEEGEVVLWRANFEEFMRRLRHKACIENVRASLDDGAAIVLRAMLEATRSLEMKVKTEKSGWGECRSSFSTLFSGCRSLVLGFWLVWGPVGYGQIGAGPIL